ncbi:MAG: hypothetical protein ACK5MI_03290 [Mangrovibacterium sp.]
MSVDFDNTEKSGNKVCKYGRYIIVSIIIIGSPIYLYSKPADYTPIVQVLLSIFLAFLAFVIGSKKEIDNAAKRANEKWMPQAESVIYRLLTLQTNVKRFAASTRSSCKRTSCDLPELEQENMKAVKIKIQTDCENTSTRLEDISLQLEDAIGDWSRFVAGNCV